MIRLRRQPPRSGAKCHHNDLHVIALDWTTSRSPATSITSRISISYPMRLTCATLHLTLPQWQCAEAKNTVSWPKTFRSAGCQFPIGHREIKSTMRHVSTEGRPHSDGLLLQLWPEYPRLHRRDYTDPATTPSIMVLWKVAEAPHNELEGRGTKSVAALVAPLPLRQYCRRQQ